jgi:hypothetical protein
MIDYTRPTQLSPAGASRREEILMLARRAARARQLRRRGTRSGAMAAIVVAALTTAALTFRPTGSPHPSPAPGTHRVSPPVASSIAQPEGPPRAAVTIARLQTQPGLADRLAVRGSDGADGIPRLNDEEFLARLSKAGRPAGLAYVDSRAVLVFHGRGRGRAGMLRSPSLPGRPDAEP